MKKWLRLARGWTRVMMADQGYCPLCDSSPPLTYCTVCYGSYEYGPVKSTERLRETWWHNFKYQVREHDLKLLYPHQKGWDQK
jgi:hypothetical protein